MSSAFGEPTRWAMHPKNGCDHKNTRRDEKYSTCLDCNHIAPLMQRCAFCAGRLRPRTVFGNVT